MPLQRKGKSVIISVSLLVGGICQFTRAAESFNDWHCRPMGDQWSCNANLKQVAAEPLHLAAQGTGVTSKEETPQVAKPPPPEIRIGKVPEMPKAPRQPVEEGKTKGWTCQGEQGTPEWQCKLVGVDPQGKPRLVARQPKPAFALPRTFTPEDDQVFSSLLQILPRDPWATFCNYGREAMPEPASIQNRDDVPMQLEADYSQSLNEDLIFFYGNVKALRGEQRLWSDTLAYDSKNRIFNAWGNVIYEESGFVMSSESAWLDIENERARLTRTRFILDSAPARGTTRRSRFEGPQLSRHHRVTYTTCPVGNEDWTIHAKDLRINRETGKASGHHVWLKFMRLPILYSPYFAYPIDKRRITGFLTPSFGSSDTRGFDFSIPYYWNIAPNYDLTVIPRIMTKRGFMIGGDFRYLFPHTQGHLAVEVLPYDQEQKKTRGQVAFYNKTKFNPYWNALADIRYVSDKHYINELGDSLSIASNRHMRSNASIDYRRGGMHFRTLAENWQTIDPTIDSSDKPYRRLPQILLDYNRSFKPWLFTGWNSEFVFFQHNERIDTQRLHLRPTLSFPWRTASAYVLPKISFDYIHYWFAAAGGQESRGLPIASLDSGLFLEKSWGNQLLQTLEPRLFYLYIPYDNQKDIPIFDTSSNDFNFSQMFRINRFNGPDRLGDANQITVALTSRLLNEKNGDERLRASVGQIYYFRDRRVTLPGQSVGTNYSSNLIAELDFQPFSTVSWRSGMQWDPHKNRFDRGEALLQYKNTEDYIINLGYRYRRDRLQIIDGSFRLLVLPGFHAVGRWQYSIDDDITLESFLGVEAESCCWRVRLIGRRYIRDVNRQADTSIFAQLELKGLVSLGRHVDRFLERNIRGYGLDD